MQSRREWFKSSIGLGGLMMAPSILTAEEIKKYNPRPLSNVVKLSSNENPYGPSERVRNAIIDSFEDACRYPYEYILELQKSLANKHNVSPESIVITGGSNEALRVTGLAIADAGGDIVAGQPTYLALMSYAESWGGKIKWVPVDSNKGYDLGKIEESIDKQTKMVFIANPNNPTGTLLEKSSLSDFCERASDRTIVFCDEAYYDYIEEPDYPSMDYLVRARKNVIVSRTFSKVYGMAGLRIGYLVLKPDLADKEYSPYGRNKIMAQTNVLAVAAASEALKDNEFYTFSLKKASQEKDKIYKLLDHLELRYVKSSTNFVFFESKKHIDNLAKEMPFELEGHFLLFMTGVELAQEQVKRWKVYISNVRSLFMIYKIY